jgi:hypothetical protein
MSHTSHSRSALTVQDLLANAGWVRALAVRLVADSAISRALPEHRCRP